MLMVSYNWLLRLVLIAPDSLIPYHSVGSKTTISTSPTIDGTGITVCGTCVYVCVCSHPHHSSQSDECALDLSVVDILKQIVGLEEVMWLQAVLRDCTDKVPYVFQLGKRKTERGRNGTSREQHLFGMLHTAWAVGLCFTFNATFFFFFFPILHLLAPLQNMDATFLCIPLLKRNQRFAW